MESEGQKIKREMANVARNIHKDIAGTLSNGLWLDQCENAISGGDQNKLALMHFINMRVEMLANPEPGVIAYATSLDQLYNLKQLGRFSNKMATHEVQRDHFDLEQSFMAYRKLYPAGTYGPLTRISYGIYQDVRDTRLGRFDVKFNEDVEPSELSSFKDELDVLLDKANDYVIDKCQNVSGDLRGNTLERLEEMRGNKDMVYAAAAFANAGGKIKRHRAVYAFGYTAFALAHFEKDKHIPFEKRCFLIEQTDRVLHHLAMTA